MVYLLLAILSSVTISLLMRVSADRVSGRLSMLCANYLVCLTLGAVHAGFGALAPAVPGFPAALGMGAVNGVLFLASFILFQSNTRQNGMVLSSLFMKLGLLVPMAVSVLAFGEVPTWLQVAGFVMAVAAILLINYEKGDTTGPRLGLVLLLLLGGAGDAMAKVFERLGDAALGDLFLFYTFATAFVLCVTLAVWRREKPVWRDLFYGALIGVPNFYSAKFLLRSLDTVDAVIAYPTFSVATILLVTLTGVWLFRERLQRRQWVALAVILVALVLLNV